MGGGWEGRGVRDGEVKGGAGGVSRLESAVHGAQERRRHLGDAFASSKVASNPERAETID